MKRILVGTYSIGYEHVKLYFIRGLDGEVLNSSDENPIPIINIGIDCDEWRDVVSIIMHEAMEFVIDRQFARYEPSANISRDADQCIFVMTHQQFSDCCARVADFIAKALPDAEKKWKNFKKK